MVIGMKGVNFQDIKIFHSAFGGALHNNVCPSQHICCWEVYGIQSYFVANLILDYTSKKRSELEALIEYHQNDITEARCVEILRNHKKQYPQQLYDVHDWSYA